MVVLYTYMHGNNTKYICVRVCVSRGSGMYDLDGSPPPPRRRSFSRIGQWNTDVESGLMR